MMKALQIKKANISTIKSGAGFTLIEVVVYLGLFAILFGGAVAVAYNVVELSDRNQTKAMVQEEGNFLIAKINWALSGADSISAPAVNASGSQLSVNKVTGVDSSGNPITTTVTINPSGSSDVAIIWSGNNDLLNNSSVHVSNLLFTHNSASGDGISPESVQAGFNMQSTTDTGASFSQNFFTTVYLRK